MGRTYSLFMLILTTDMTNSDKIGSLGDWDGLVCFSVFGLACFTCDCVYLLSYQGRICSALRSVLGRYEFHELYWSYLIQQAARALQPFSDRINRAFMYCVCRLLRRIV